MTVSIKEISKLNDVEFLKKEKDLKQDTLDSDDKADSNGKKVKKLKLTKWGKEPKLTDLKKDFDNTKTSHSNFITKLDKWNTLYDAPAYGGKNHNGSRIVPKLVRKQAEWRYPSLSEAFLSNTQLFDVKPLTFDDVARAKQNALILNMQFNTQIDKVTLVDTIIRSVVKDGNAIVRLGWEYKEEKVKEKVKQFTYMPVPEDEQVQQQVQQQYQALAQLKQTNPDSYEQADEAMKAGMEMSEEKQQLLVAQESGDTEQEVTKPVINKPTIEMCNIRNVYIDPTCKGNLDNAQFLIYSFESSLSDLKKLDIYENLDYLKDSLDSTTLDYSKPDNSDFAFADVARRKLTIYEYWGYWDIEGNGTTKAIVASWVGDTLIRMEENPFPDKKIPFVVFNYIPEEESIYGIPDAELLEDNQAILGAVTRGMIDLMGKSANSQTGYSKGFLDPTNKIKFRKGEDYEYNPNYSPAMHVFTHKYPEIPASALNMVQMMNNEAEALSGVKAFTGTGINASYLGDTAVAARGVLDAVSKREMSILRRISKGFIAIGRKIMSMNTVWLSEEEVVRVTNTEFTKVRRDDLLGNFDLVLGISTAEADDAKAKELAFMLQTVGNNMGSELFQMMVSEVATLRKMPDLAEKLKQYKPQPDPTAEKMKELDIAYREAEIELMKSQAQENMAKAQLQGVKQTTEQARAESLQGDADKKTLDFVERDSGADHQKELEKQGMSNDVMLQQQAMKDEAKSQQLYDQHNANLLQNLASAEIQPKTETNVPPQLM